MEELISAISRSQNWQESIKQWCIENCMERLAVLTFPISRIQKMYQKVVDKYGQEKSEIEKQQNYVSPVWLEHQLILLQWASVVLGFSRKIYLQDFGKPELQYLSAIFRQKQHYIIEYEIKCMLVKGKQKRKGWQVEEENMLSTLIEQHPYKNKWNQIARELYKISDGKYFRQGKHCRQRWFTSQGESKSMNQWNQQTDNQLLQLVSVIGQKWKQIACYFSEQGISRLEIKKRFRFLLARAKHNPENRKADNEAMTELLKVKQKKIKRVKINQKLSKKKSSKETRTEKKKFDAQEKRSHEIQSSSGNDDSQFLEKSNQDDHQMNKKIQMEPEQNPKKDQTFREIPKLFYDGSNEYTSVVYNMGHAPPPFYPQVYQIIAPNFFQQVNYYSSESPYNAIGPFIFY